MEGQPYQLKSLYDFFFSFGLNFTLHTHTHSPAARAPGSLISSRVGHQSSHSPSSPDRLFHCAGLSIG